MNPPWANGCGRRPRKASAHHQSSITYPGGGNFAREKFVIHYNDNSLKPSFAALGLPPTEVRSNYILVVSEEGALLV